MAKFKRKASMRDIAERLSISKYAVSLALNNKPGVSEELRKMVFKVAEELNYGGLGENIKKNNYILVLVPEYLKDDKIFYYEIFWAIEKHTKELGYHSIITSVSEQMQENLILPQLFYEISFSGIMAVGVFSEKYITTISRLDIPLVMVDHYFGDLKLNTVITANIEGAYTIVKYLINNGHKEIGFIGPIIKTASFFERWCGYNKSMLEHGLNVYEKYCITDASNENELLTSTNQIDECINKLDKLPTAWFCANDRIAISLISLLQEKGVSVPDDVSVVGFDDIEAARFLNPALTTMNVNKTALGVKAVDLLTSKIENNEEKEIIKVFSELVVRHSVKSVK